MWLILGIREYRTYSSFIILVDCCFFQVENVIILETIYNRSYCTSGVNYKFWHPSDRFRELSCSSCRSRVFPRSLALLGGVGHVNLSSRMLSFAQPLSDSMDMLWPVDPIPGCNDAPGAKRRSFGMTS